MCIFVQYNTYFLELDRFFFCQRHVKIELFIYLKCLVKCFVLSVLSKAKVIARYDKFCIFS